MDPIDGSPLSQDMWIRKGLLVKGLTDDNGTFAADLLLPATASSEVIAVAELSDINKDNLVVTEQKTATGVATVGDTTTLTLVDLLTH